MTVHFGCVGPDPPPPPPPQLVARERRPARRAEKPSLDEVFIAPPGSLRIETVIRLPGDAVKPNRERVLKSARGPASVAMTPAAAAVPRARATCTGESRRRASG